MVENSLRMEKVHLFDATKFVLPSFYNKRSRVYYGMLGLFLIK